MMTPVKVVFSSIANLILASYDTPKVLSMLVDAGLDRALRRTQGEY